MCGFVHLCRFAIPTESKCRWAVRLFTYWQNFRNQQAETRPELDISPIRVGLLDMTKDELCFSLSRFICEIRKKNTKDYPAESLYDIIICIQLHLEMHGREFKLLDDPAFIQLKHTLDNTMKEHAKAGLTVKRRQAQPISRSEEEDMWSRGILGSESPSQLLETLVYVFGLNFALRAAQEHRNLRWKTPESESQIQVHTASNGKRFLRYTEDTSKTRQGGLRHRKLEPKVVNSYENTEKPERCIVRLYEKYVSHCPKVRGDALYLRPLKSPVGQVWYGKQPVGINKLSTVVKRLCGAAGLKGHRTNHSLRATAASRLYACEFDEQLIAETTGHRSNSVRKYKRTNEDLQQKASYALQGIEGIDGISGTGAGAKKSRTVAPATCTTLDADNNNVTVHVTCNINVPQDRSQDRSQER